MSDLTAVSLFAGIGGIDRALELAGVRVAAAVEIDPDCRGVLRRHFPETAIFNDVTEVTGDHLRAAGFVPGRGILAAGWPCQGNSVAGRRGGMADPRSGLWVHVARLLAELRPRWFLGENVPGLLSVNDGRDIAVVRRDLAQLGYWWAERILDAQFFGVPQRRRRVFFVGCPGDRRGPVEVLLEPESGHGDHAAGSEAGPGTAPASGGGAVSALQGGGRRGHRIDAEGAAGGHLLAVPLLEVGARTGQSTDGPRAGAGIGSGGDPMFTLQAGKQHGIAIPIQDGRDFDKAQNGIGVGVEGEPSFTLDTTGGQSVAAFPVALRGRDGGGQIECGDDDSPAFAVRTPGGGGSYPMVATFGGEGVRDALTSEGADASEDGTGRGTPIISLAVAGDFSSSEGHAQTVRSAHGQPGVIAVGFAENQRGELVESAVSHQLTTGGGKPGQGFLAVRQEALVRRLTPLECERLQGFPDGWTERFLAPGQATIMVPWPVVRALFPDAADRLLTANEASASCITSASSDTEVSIFRSATIPALTDAASVTGWLDSTGHVAIAAATTSHGSGTATRSDRTPTLPPSRQEPSDGPGTTDGRPRLRLVGPCDAARLSTILTWIRATTNPEISTSAQTIPSTCAFTPLWNQQPPNSFDAGYCALRVATTKPASDAARYRQLGNSVAVPCVEWITRRIAAADRSAIPSLVADGLTRTGTGAVA